jgi:hypothetical protein
MLWHDMKTILLNYVAVVNWLHNNNVNIACRQSYT